MSLNLCSSLVSVAVIKLTESVVGEEMVYLANKLQSIIEKRQVMGLEQELKRDHREMLLTGLLSLACSASFSTESRPMFIRPRLQAPSCFPILPGPPAQGWNHLLW